METGTKVCWEVFDSRVHSCPPVDPCEGESWEWVLLELDKRMLVSKGRVIR